MSVYAVSEGLFDSVVTAKIKDAQADLLTRLWSKHKEEMRELNNGEKKFIEYEKTVKIVRETAEKVAKGFEG